MGVLKFLLLELGSWLISSVGLLISLGFLGGDLVAGCDHCPNHNHRQSNRYQNVCCNEQMPHRHKRAPAQHTDLSLIHISEPTRLLSISYAVFCLKKKKPHRNNSREKRNMEQ
eukprot:TRINITY_DN57724_c0_g1_i1.p1 TRINITY_DN57724_c0_g1~~TRINITY_DN57724_c0_g1_i1.p1  ORF type:complete len:113 (-),score=2.64 TRINITY_DN57724_c0_g1_i1:92-430(-)